MDITENRGTAKALIIQEDAGSMKYLRGTKDNEQRWQAETKVKRERNDFFASQLAGFFGSTYGITPC